VTAAAVTAGAARAGLAVTGSMVTDDGIGVWRLVRHDQVTGRHPLARIG
jgi:hypothetical protein